MSTEQITPLEHSSVVGGSTAARRLHCPRSIYLESLLPDLPEQDSPYAREGTALHEMMAKILTDGIEDAETLLPFKHIQLDRGTGEEKWHFTVDTELWRDKGAPALEAFDRFVADMEDQTGEIFEYVVEQRVQFPGIDNAFGTSDIVGRCGEEVFVIDWKFGRGPVEAEDNAQLMFYAVGALNTCAEFLNEGLADEVVTDPRRPVTAAIIQPVLRDDPDIWETDLGNLNCTARELREAVQEGQTKGANARIAKGKGCNFCDCKAICPLFVADTAAMTDKMARLRDRQAARAEAAAAATGPEHYDATRVAAADADIAALLAEMLDLTGPVCEWAGAVEKLAHEMALNGTAIPGRKLVEKTGGSRSWAKGEEEVKKLLKRLGLKMDEMLPRKLITMPAAEKAVKPLGKAIPDDFVSKPGVTGYKLVRTDHPDAEAQVGATDVTEMAAKLSRLTGGAAS